MNHQTLRMDETCCNGSSGQVNVTKENNFQFSGFSCKFACSNFFGCFIVTLCMKWTLPESSRAPINHQMRKFFQQVSLRSFFCVAVNTKCSAWKSPRADKLTNERQAFSHVVRNQQHPGKWAFRAKVWTSKKIPEFFFTSQNWGLYLCRQLPNRSKIDLWRIF